jgi:hypothetical protein
LVPGPVLVQVALGSLPPLFVAHELVWHSAWMLSVLLVPEQGLPKTVVVAGTLHDAFQRQSVETTDTEVVALQEPVL